MSSKIKDKRKERLSLESKEKQITASKKKSVKRKSEKKYTLSNLEDAFTAVQNKEMSLRKACKKFNIPASTLSVKLRSLCPMNATKGPPTILTKQEEDRIVQWIICCGQKGLPVTKSALLDSVQYLLNLNARKTPFTNNRPGRTWYGAFMRRHNELSVRTAQNLSNARASINEENLRHWFGTVGSYLEKKDLLHMDPSRYYNFDESAFFLCPKADKVIVKKGSKSVYKVINGDEKESLTVLYGGSASGMMAPPMVLYWYTHRIPDDIRKRMPNGWSFGSTQSGWMTSESFLEYFENVFYPWLIRNNITFPIVVFVDGHSSHITLALSDFCSEHGIELVALYPNATHLLQPCDKALFHPLKNQWKLAADKWRKQYQRLTKADFAPILQEATAALNFKEIMTNGFKACGLYPFSADAVDFNVLNKTKVQRENHCKNITEDKESGENVSINKEQFLQYFEEQIDSSVLDEFNLGIVSDQKNLGLFKFWHNLKTNIGFDGNAFQNLDIILLDDKEDSSIIIDNIDLKKVDNNILEMQPKDIVNIEDSQDSGFDENSLPKFDLNNDTSLNTFSDSLQCNKNVELLDLSNFKLLKVQSQDDMESMKNYIEQKSIQKSPTVQTQAIEQTIQSFKESPQVQIQSIEHQNHETKSFEQLSQAQIQSIEHQIHEINSFEEIPQLQIQSIEHQNHEIKSFEEITQLQIQSIEHLNHEPKSFQELPQVQIQFIEHLNHEPKSFKQSPKTPSQSINQAIQTNQSASFKESSPLQPVSIADAMNATPTKNLDDKEKESSKDCSAVCENTLSPTKKKVKYNVASDQELSPFSKAFQNPAKPESLKKGLPKKRRAILRCPIITSEESRKLMEEEQKQKEAEIKAKEERLAKRAEAQRKKAEAAKKKAQEREEKLKLKEQMKKLEEQKKILAGKLKNIKVEK